jgi:hypothetical protein
VVQRTRGHRVECNDVRRTPNLVCGQIFVRDEFIFSLCRGVCSYKHIHCALNVLSPEIYAQCRDFPAADLYPIFFDTRICACIGSRSRRKTREDRSTAGAGAGRQRDNCPNGSRSSSSTMGVRLMFEKRSSTARPYRSGHRPRTAVEKIVMGDALVTALQPMNWDPSVKSIIAFPFVRLCASEPAGHRWGAPENQVRSGLSAGGGSQVRIRLGGRVRLRPLRILRVYKKGGPQRSDALPSAPGCAGSVSSHRPQHRCRRQPPPSAECAPLPAPGIPNHTGGTPSRNNRRRHRPDHGEILLGSRYDSLGYSSGIPALRRPVKRVASYRVRIVGML